MASQQTYIKIINNTLVCACGVERCGSNGQAGVFQINDDHTISHIDTIKRVTI